MPDPLPSVSLVILNLNGRHHLETLLPTVEAQDYPADRLQVIVTDNGSSDGSADYVRRHFPQFDLVALEGNLGFAEGNNRGAAAAKNEWIGFLNNDMRLPPTWISDMVSLLDRHPDAASIGSKIMNWQGTEIDYVGSRINFQGHGIQVDYGDKRSSFDRERRVLAPCGGAMMIRRDVFEQLQGWDGDFFGFFEDVDLGWRVNLLGYDAWYNPQAVVYHRLHGTYDKMKAYRLGVLYERNALFSIYKCLEDDHLEAVLPAALYLLNDRALEIAGVERAFFHVNHQPAGPPAKVEPPAPKPLPPEARSPLPVKAVRYLRKNGLERTLRRSAVFAGKLLSRFDDGPPPTEDDHVTIPRIVIGHYVGLSEFAHSLDRMKPKRRWLQAHRKRSDAEIFEINGDILEPVHSEPGFLQFYHWLVEELDLRRRLAPEERPVRAAARR